MRLVLLTLLLTANASAQIRLQANQTCDSPTRVPAGMRGHVLPGPRTDSQGRCTARARMRPWNDVLYGTLAPDPWRLARRHDPWDGDAGWVDADVRDHLNFRVGTGAWHPATHTYVFFNRYGVPRYVLQHVRRDQYAVFNSFDQRIGVVYGTATPRPGTWDARILQRYPFLYDYGMGL